MLGLCVHVHVYTVHVQYIHVCMCDKKRGCIVSVCLHGHCCLFACCFEATLLSFTMWVYLVSTVESGLEVEVPIELGSKDTCIYMYVCLLYSRKIQYASTLYFVEPTV